MYAKPFTPLLRLLTLLGPAVVLIGCGEGDGQTRIPGTPLPPEVGVLVDAPVAGAAWVTSGGAAGVTNALGEFEYGPFESVTFSVGGIVLGTAPGAPVISAVELAGKSDPNDPEVVNRLVFMQSIDADEDPSNGIEISANTQSLAEGQTLDFSSPNFSSEVAAVVAAITEPDNAVVSESAALFNFYQTYAALGGTDTFNFPFPGFPPVGGGITYELVFADEFNVGTAPDSAKWNIETGYGQNGWGNNEWQLYTGSPDNVRVEGGNLVIQARCDTPPCGVRDGTITSARINTKDKFEYKFGKILARIKPPVGDGAWPAFWSLGAVFPETPWPRAGEIDYMEMHNAFSDENTTHFTMHWCDERITLCAPDNFPAGWIFETQNRSFSQSLGDDFHIFEADWDANRVVGKIDGITYFTYDIDPSTMEEFLREFFMILNVAMGGTLGSDNQPPNGNEVWPQTMLVDYVRVFQQVGGSEPAGDLVIDFENAPETYAFTNFEGGVASVIDNPDAGGINTSAQVGRMQKFAADSGATFGGSLLTLDSPFGVESGADGTMKVWAQRSVRVLLKLEGAEGSGDVEMEVTHGGSGWEELAFDFSGYSGTVEAVTLIFDNGDLGMAGSMPDDWTFYFDDITVVQAADTGEQIDLPITFDDPDVDYTLTDFGDPVATMTRLVFDPEDMGNLVASTTKPLGAPLWAGVTMSTEAGLASPIPFTATDTTIGMRVYSPAAGIPVRLKADNVVNGDVSVETEVLTTVANEWETLVFDFASPVAETPALDLETSYTALSVFFNFGTDGDTAGEQIYLWDDVVFGVPLPDLIPPTLTDVSIASSNANPALATVGDTVTVSLTADEAILEPMVTIADEPADAVTGAGTGWTASRVLTGAEAEGALGFSVAFSDEVGNEGVTVTETTDVSGVLLDFTSPMVTIGGAPPSFDDAAVPIPLTVQFSEPVSGFASGDIVVTNGAANNFMTIDAATYTVNFVPTGIGDLTVGIAAGVAADAAGNLNGMAASVTVSNLIPLGTPALLVGISSNNTTTMGLDGYATLGDEVTLAISSSEQIEEPDVTIAGMAPDTITGGPSDWSATLIMTEAVPEGLIGFDIADVISLQGVTGPGRDSTTDGSSMTYDRTAPTLTISGVPDDILTREDIPVTFDFGEVVVDFDLADISVANGVADMLESDDGAVYTAVIMPDDSPLSTLTVSVAASAATDPAGNPNPEASDSGVLGDLQPFWRPVWSDDFDGDAVEPMNWTVRTDADCPAPCTGQQSYRSERVSVAAGQLNLEARDDVARGGPVFTSGLIDSRGKRQLRHGRVEVDAIMPAGTFGTSPSIWLLPATDAYGTWPASGEIDVVNAPNLNQTNSDLEHTLIYGLPVPEETATVVNSAAPVNNSTEVSTYAIEWEAGEIRWFVDGVHVATQTQDNWYSYSEDDDGVYMLGMGAAPFDEDFYLLLSLAVNDSTNGISAFPQTFVIDAVRVFECANPDDAAAGTGCGTTDPGVTPVEAPGAPYAEMLDVYTDAPAVLGFIDPTDPGTPVDTALVGDIAVSGGGVTVNSTLDAMDGGDIVWNLDINAAAGTGSAFIRAPDAGTATGFFDLSGGETAGELLFRMRVNTVLDGTQVMVGLDSGAGNGRYELSPVTADGVWRQYSVKIADVIMNGPSLDLGGVTNLFVIEAGNGAVNLDLDDVEVVVACRDNGACEATPRLPVAPMTIFGPEDFEDNDPVNDTIIGAGWTYFNNVFEAGVYQFSYNGQAPNGPQMSAIAVGEGGPTQGAQQLSIYSDYECCGGTQGHFSANGLVEVNIFREPRGVGATSISASDVGSVWTFSFDAKRGNIAGSTEHVAFIKVLDPGSGFSETALVTADMTATTTDWTRYNVELTIGDWVGQLLQFGFQTKASNFESSGVFYDNIEVTSVAGP